MVDYAREQKLTEKEARSRKYFMQTHVIKYSGIAKNTIKNYRLAGVFKDVLADAKYGDTYFLSNENIKAIIDKYNESEKLNISHEHVLDLLYLEPEYRQYNPDRVEELQELLEQGYELPSPLNNWTMSRPNTQKYEAPEVEIFDNYDSIPRKEEGKPNPYQGKFYQDPPEMEEFITKVVETMVGNMKDQLTQQIQELVKQQAETQLLLAATNEEVKKEREEKKVIELELYKRRAYEKAIDEWNKLSKWRKIFNPVPQKSAFGLED